MPSEQSILRLYTVFEIRRNLSGTVYRYVLPVHLCRARIRPEHAPESGIKTFVCVWRPLGPKEKINIGLLTSQETRSYYEIQLLYCSIFNKSKKKISSYILESLFRVVFMFQIFNAIRYTYTKKNNPVYKLSVFNWELYLSLFYHVLSVIFHLSSS